MKELREVFIDTEGINCGDCKFLRMGSKKDQGLICIIYTKEIKEDYEPVRCDECLNYTNEETKLYKEGYEDANNQTHWGV